MAHNGCSMCTRGLPDMYTLTPRACGPWVYISGKPEGKPLVPILQL